MSMIMAWIDKDALKVAISALKYELQDLAKKGEKAPMIEDALDQLGRAKEYDREADDEQYAKIDKLVSEYENSTGWHHSTGNLSSRVEYMVRSLKEKRDGAFGAFAALVEEQRTSMRALEFMVKSALGCATHKWKDARLHVLHDSINEMLHGLLSVDTDDPHRYTYVGFGETQWDFRKLMAQNLQLQRQVEELLHPAQEVQAKPQDEELPF